MKAINDLVPDDIWKMHEAAEKAVHQAFMWMPFLSGRVSIRVANLVRRAYHKEYLTESIDKLSDEQLTDIRGIGPKTLAEIRTAIAQELKVRRLLNRG